RMERLELEFGNEVYACRECGHVDDSVGKIRGHLGKEHPSEKALANRERKREAASLPAEQEPAEETRPESDEEESTTQRSVMDYTISEVLGLATENRDLREENTELRESRDEWRNRAHESEKSLKKIRKALG